MFLLLDRLSFNGTIYTSEISSDTCFDHLVLIEFSNESQYDILIKFNDIYGRELPDGLLCIAGSGNKFHGWRNRPWEALKGNIHLSVYLRPERQIEHFGAAFLLLSAVSVVSALDEFLRPDSAASIKWVNDIFIGNAKVCGFLANSQLRGSTLSSVVLGIGLNVMAVPDIEPTAYVPATTALIEHISTDKNIFEIDVFNSLIHQLSENYRKILNDAYQELYTMYCGRSSVKGKYAEIYTDLPDGTDVLSHSGIALSIGHDLELYLDNSPNPIISGRLVFR